MYARCEVEGTLLHVARILYDRRTRSDYIEGVLVVGERQTDQGPRPCKRVVFRSRRQEDIARVRVMGEGDSVRITGDLDARTWADDNGRVWSTPLVTIEGDHATLEVLP